MTKKRTAVIAGGVAAGAVVAGAVGRSVVHRRREHHLEHVLWDVPNLHISPHSSASQDRYFEMIFEIFLDNLAAYVAGKPLQNVVDWERGY